MFNSELYWKASAVVLLQYGGVVTGSGWMVEGAGEEKEEVRRMSR